MKGPEMLNWVFEPVGGGGRGFTERRVLESADIDPNSVFVREVLQNSIDAQRDECAKTEVNFRATSPGTADAERVEEILKLEREGGPIARKAISPSSSPNGLLYVEDYGTEGLTGGSDAGQVGEGGNFVNLCLIFGTTDKEEGQGSFGHGKSVLWRSSEVSVVIFYSRFSPHRNVRSRLLGVGWFNKHARNGRKYTGRGRLEAASDEADWDNPRPLTNEEADEVAAALGFEPRGPGDRGTSLLICSTPFASADKMDLLRRLTEAHFWPRLVEDNLSVSFSFGGQDLGSPRPRQREDLSDFLAAYELATGRRKEPPPGRVGDVDEMTYKPAEGDDRLTLGSVGVVSPADQEEQEAIEEDQLRGVALIRKPRMVVEYRSSRSFPEVEFGAAFVADDGIDSILRASEPLAHNSWNSDSADLDEVGGKIVDAVHRKVTGHVSGFLSDLHESRREESSTSPALGQEFARYLLAGSGGGGNGAGKRDVRIQFLTQPGRMQSDAGPPTVGARFEVWSPKDRIEAFEEEHGTKPAAIGVTVEAPLAYDFNRTGDEIPIATFRDEELAGKLVDDVLYLPADPDTKHRITVVTDRLPHESLTVQLRVRASLVEEMEEIQT